MYISENVDKITFNDQENGIGMLSWNFNWCCFCSLWKGLNQTLLSPTIGK